MKEVIKSILPSAFKQKLSQLKKKYDIRVEASLTLRPTDVFLVGHPKSGNTWVAFMLAVLLSERLGKKVTMANVYEFVPNIHMPGVKVKQFEDIPSPRIFRNENPTWQDHYPKTIYLVRDPRAVLLSYYHHWLHAERDHHGTLEEFVDEMLEFGCIRRWESWLTRWDLQVDEWEKRQKTQPVLIVRYEDLIEDREGYFRKIVDFAGLNCSDKMVSLAVEKGGFESMQKSEKKYGAESFNGKTSDKGLFVRKGQVDSWKEEMPDHVIAKIEKEFGETMSRFGYL